MKGKDEVTIYDIARELSVSPSTVSRALNRIPLVRKKTRDKIQQKALEMGYRQNFFASSLRTQRTYGVGMVVPHANMWFNANIISGAETVAGDMGYHVIIKQSMEDEDKFIKIMEGLKKCRVDGIALTATELAMLRAKGGPTVPMIVMEGAYLTDSSDRGMLNMFEIATTLTDRLIQRGCRRIMFLCAKESNARCNLLLKGYQHALSINGIKEDFVASNIDMAGASGPYKLHKMLIAAAPDGVVVSDGTVAAFSIIGPETVVNNWNLDITDHPLSNPTEMKFHHNENTILSLGKTVMSLLICLIEVNSPSPNTEKSLP